MKKYNASDITYRLLEEQEEVSQQLYDLSNESFEYGSPWTIKQFQETLNLPNLFYLIAEDKGKLIGFLSGSMIAFPAGALVESEAEVYNLVVGNDYKRRGIAMRLIEEAKKVMLSRKITELFLEVRISNKPAILLYKKANFQPVGVRSKYYSNPKEDAIVLKCVL
ncbi:ribosomal protein S18-alanine N-acetyltransferase [Marinilactibacillus psychrotolerans]|uniref:Ribosomal protein S18-alanine N-acetyltransferase n=1 Tax=Marinilactibacillus psychrotolerans TaxID=191770 RepID=A0ABW8UM12_9LACT